MMWSKYSILTTMGLGKKVKMKELDSNMYKICKGKGKSELKRGAFLRKL